MKNSKYPIIWLTGQPGSGKTTLSNELLKIISNFEDKINELKIKLPKAADPVGSYVATKISNKMLFKILNPDSFNTS